MGLFKNFDFEKLKSGLAKTRDKIINSITESISGKASIDEKTLDEIEEILISSDIGFSTVEKIIKDSRIKLKSDKGCSDLNIIKALKNELNSILDFGNSQSDKLDDIAKFKPYVILIIGINGTGKTTTIGKLAYNFKNAGLKVCVGAADTFRAAANEQLDIWAKRAGVEIVQKGRGSDPSSVAYDVINNAITNNIDVVIIDTAGRLHNKSNLMEELSKIKRVIKRLLPYAPNETLLIIDGNTGQNALVQVDEFSRVIDLTGLVITKLDGTAKGGVIFQICQKQKIPVKYIGVGEKIDDLQEFDAKQFVNAIFNN